VQGPKALREEAIRRTQWHDPIPQILLATQEVHVSGYPVYDDHNYTQVIKMLEK
jgi:hypothetical protein